MVFRMEVFLSFETYTRVGSYKNYLKREEFGEEGRRAEWITMPLFYIGDRVE